MYTFFTATIGEEDDDSSSDSNLKMLAEMTHDGERVKANQFLYKAILVNTLLALHTSKLDEQLAGRLHNTLQGVMMAQIAYAEGDRHHPFLEEVVKLLADFYEMTQNHRSALNSINLLLQIQERLFFTGSAPRKEMLPTYQKIASLSSQLGESEKAAKYAEMEQLVLEAEEQAEGTSAARKKEIVQELARLYFKQYLIASQAENVAKSV